MNLIQINKFSHLHDEEQIFFSKTDYLEQAFKKISKLKYKVILISGNSDYCITDEVIKKMPQNIHKWFCQNRLSDNPTLEAIPIGIENTIECKIQGHGHVWPHAHEKNEILQKIKPQNTDNKNLIYANFNISTNQKHRVFIRDYILKLQHITWKEPSLKYIEFINDISRHDAVICAQGNGPGDNHRIYETMYVNKVAITFNQIQYKYLHRLYPTLLIETIEDLKDQKKIEERIKVTKTKINKEYLDCDYWIEKIIKEKNQL